MPTRAELERLPIVGRFAHRLADRDLWRLRPQGLARGAAVGVFWAFAVPVAQILFVCLHCVWWRGHLPVAAAVTLITNPLTIGPWLVAAYQVGSWMIGDAAAPPLAAAGAGWLAKAGALGWPTVVGMGTFAVGGALLAYLLVLLAARLHLAWRLGRRGARRPA